VSPSTPAAFPPSPPPLASRGGKPYLAGAPLLLAHRGGSGLAPENTAAAFTCAVEWWRADVLELDVQCSRDGQAVVIHDATVDRTTDARGRVSTFTAAELRDLDAGYRFTPDRGVTHPFRGAGEGILTLAEVVERFQSVRINIEIKDGRAQPSVMETVRSAGAAHRVLVAAGRLGNRSLFAGWPGPTSASGEELRGFYLRYVTGRTRAYRPPVDALQMPERYLGRRVLSPALVRVAHEHNLAVHVWTVNSEVDMRRLLDWNVDGLVTDRPDRLARILVERGVRPPPPGAPEDSLEPWLERLLRA
jgi:glycerophosphoryl diester phosphodiesterase